MIRTKNVADFPVSLSVPGTLSASASAILACYAVPFACKVKAVVAKLVTAGITGNSDVDIQKNGTTILSSTGGIRFATTVATPNAITFTVDPTLLAAGDVLTVLVPAVASTAPIGLCLSVLLERVPDAAKTIVDGTYGSDTY